MREAPNRRRTRRIAATSRVLGGHGDGAAAGPVDQGPGTRRVGESGADSGGPGGGARAGHRPGAAPVAAQVDDAGGPGRRRWLRSVAGEGARRSRAHRAERSGGDALGQPGQDLPGDLPVVRGQAGGVAGEALLARRVPRTRAPPPARRGSTRRPPRRGPACGGPPCGPHGWRSGRPGPRRRAGTRAGLGCPAACGARRTRSRRGPRRAAPGRGSGLVGQGPAPAVDPGEAVDAGLVEAHRAAEEPGGGQRQVEQGRRRGWGVEHHEVVALRRPSTRTSRAAARARTVDVAPAAAARRPGGRSTDRRPARRGRPARRSPG